MSNDKWVDTWWGRILITVVAFSIFWTLWTLIVTPWTNQPKANITAYTDVYGRMVICKNSTERYAFGLTVVNEGDKGSQIRYAELISNIRELIPYSSCTNSSMLRFGGYLESKKTSSQCIEFDAYPNETLEKIGIKFHTDDGLFSKENLVMLKWIYDSSIPTDVCLELISPCEPSQCEEILKGAIAGVK